MITLYTWATPNGQKVSIALEELGLPYRVQTIDITAGEQFDPAFLALNPNNKIPVIVDADGPGGTALTVFESGAILIYLAEKCARLLPAEPRARSEVLQWLMLQVGGVGPMLGQAHHFRRFAAERIPYAIQRYTDEAARLYGVLDKRLAAHSWLGGDTYSIADIATYPWIARHEWQGISLADYPNLRRWFDKIASRPAVQRGMEIPR
ncbi:glutathione S-transferase family protein [Pseudothauera lacus]|uniref:Glutathione S-transferase n=1 Tax=Pseudothauera lacus TaxID=2136175 RepID=A0A2T4IDN0_9RHOO|nr:glutathione binding-like protein [Pseudothauera lacus]PTD95858.1 glutathione S-transferase [Pseudothauera lacus]